MSHINSIIAALSDVNLTLAERVDLAASLAGMGNRLRSLLFDRWITPKPVYMFSHHFETWAGKRFGVCHVFKAANGELIFHDITGETN